MRIFQIVCLLGTGGHPPTQPERSNRGQMLPRCTFYRYFNIFIYLNFVYPVLVCETPKNVTINVYFKLIK